MIVRCRDCGELGDEAPDDPAPALCPDCYERRLASITPQFEVMVMSADDLEVVVQWLEDALHEIGGETPEYAHKHARELQLQVMLGPPW